MIEDEDEDEEEEERGLFREGCLEARQGDGLVDAGELAI